MVTTPLLSTVKAASSRRNPRESVCRCTTRGCGHLGFDALDQRRFAQCASWFEQVLHFDDGLMYRGIFRSQLERHRRKIQCVSQIWWPRAFGSWIEKIRDRGGGPGSFDDGLYACEKFACKVVQRAAV